MPMNDASTFWLDTLRHCEIDRPLALPFDRHRLSDQKRSIHGVSIAFDFGQDLSQAFLTYASNKNTTAKHLALASYYAFLFKLTNGEQNLCVAINTDGRYKTELQSLMGQFVNTIPLPYQVDPSNSFAQLVDEVHAMAERISKYSYFPLQRILAQHPHASKTSFQDLSFDFHTIATTNSDDHFMLGDVSLIHVSQPNSANDGDVDNQVDFSLRIQHDLSTDQLSCTISASPDVFNIETVEKIGQRYLLLLQQLFPSTNNFEITTQSLFQLSLLLPDESRLLQTINNTQVLFPPATCVHHQFASTAVEHSQKVAIELDDQSLTYNELLYYAQLFAVHLLDQYDIQPGEIICQCVERSISMVSVLVLLMI